MRKARCSASTVRALRPRLTDHVFIPLSPSSPHPPSSIACHALGGSMAPLKLGFIGVGYIAQKTHLPALAPLLEAGEVALQAFCDVDEGTLREAAQQYGVEALYTDHHAM